MTSPGQLPLPLPHETSTAREDFLPAPENALALAVVDAWPDWPGPIQLLEGPPGSGKSHLGAIWARRAGALVIKGAELAAFTLKAAELARALLIDDADKVGAGEAVLFHLINFARENGAALLLTAQKAPDLWGLATPDLRSRLRLAPVTRLAAPDTALVKAVLFKLFSDRQLVVEPTLVNYIALRLERSLDAAREIVAALDHEALAQGKRVTRTMAADYFRTTETR